METMTDDEPMKYRRFSVSGKIYSPNESVARHHIFWALRNSEYDDQILIDETIIEGEN